MRKKCQSSESSRTVSAMGPRYREVGETIILYTTNKHFTTLDIPLQFAFYKPNLEYVCLKKLLSHRIILFMNSICKNLFHIYRILLLLSLKLVF